MKTSIIIPVFSELDSINSLIADLRVLSGSPATEIIVIDGDPAGSTIRTIGDRSVMTAIAPKGRALQMNRGAELASGEILLFLHADTFLPRDGLVRIREAMRDGRSMAGAFNLGIRSERSVFRITERYVALRTRLTRIPFGDQAIFVRRSCFEKIGGYSTIPIMEDIDLMKRIKKLCGGIVLLPQKAMTSSRRWEGEGILYCTLRNWSLQLCYCLGVSPDRLAAWYK